MHLAGVPITTETWAVTFRDNFEDGNLSGWQFDKNNWKDVEFQVEFNRPCSL